MLRRGAEMLGQQTRTDGCNAALGSDLTRLDREIALSVESRRAPVEIRGADAQELVVDDQDLGVDEDLRVAVRSRDDRIKCTKPPIVVGAQHAPDDAIAIAVHDPALEQAVPLARGENDDL